MQILKLTMQRALVLSVMPHVIKLGIKKKTPLESPCDQALWFGGDTAQL